ncbi:MAG: hypothetical protein GXO82_10350, partial [Chlorobi bacterium]|nr:hypothetical protein [Chlorobiota bacterium]
MRRFFLSYCVLLLLVCATAASSTEVPELRSYVTDKAGVLTASEVSALETMLRDYDRRTSTQMVVLIVPSLEGESIEEYAIAVAEKNRIGRKGKDNGLLFLVAVNDRKLRFEVGYGLEPVLTDALTSTIIRRIITPSFREGDYYGGIKAGLETAMKVASNEFPAGELKDMEEDTGKTKSIGKIIVWIIIIIFVFIPRRRRRGGGGLWFFGGPFIGGGGFGGGGFGGGG